MLSVCSPPVLYRCAAACARRSTALLAALSATLPWAAQAQSSSPPGQPPVVVTATRTPIRADQALGEVSIIDRTQIEAAAGRTLAELLARLPGVQFWANGGPGALATLSLRGLEGRHTLLLIDGIRYGSATLGTPIWDNLPLEAIERIEVVRGPLSGLYGSDAVGGVVQVFTRGGAAGLHPDASLMVGSYGTSEAGAGLRFGTGPWDGSVRVQQLRTHGFSATNAQVPFDQFNADDDGFRQRSVQARLGVVWAGWRAEGLLLASRGTTHYDDGLGTDAQARVRTALQSLSLSGTPATGWQTSVKLARSQDDNEVTASASPFAELGNTGTVQHQISWENRVATPLGTLLVLAEHLRQDVSRPVTPYEVSRRSISAVGLGLNGSQGMHSWQASVRRDRNSQFGQPSTGAVAYGLQLMPGWQATVSAGKSFVAPSFNQLYYPGFGNPNLLPEEGRQREAALRWQGQGVSARLAFFEHRIRGFITGGPVPENISLARIDGLSASVDAMVQAWTLAASFDSLNPVNASVGAFAGANFGKLLPRRTTESARLSADWRGGPVTLGGTLVAQGERYDDQENSLRMPGHAVLDLRANWTVAPGWVVGMMVNNVLNKPYETAYGYNQPGRSAYLTLRWVAR